MLYEADPRHAEMLIRALADSSNNVATPGDKSIEVDIDAELHDAELDGMHANQDTDDED